MIPASMYFAPTVERVHIDILWWIWHLLRLLQEYTAKYRTVNVDVKSPYRSVCK